MKDSVVLISQDDRASGLFLLGRLTGTQDWERTTKDVVKTHVYVPHEEECLLFHYGFTGIIRGDKTLEQVDIDMLKLLDEDFDIEISEELYHQYLSCVCMNEELATIE